MGVLARVKFIWISMRPRQWIKNTFLFSGLVFSKNLFQGDLFLKVSGGFVLFCLAASSIYIFNDIRDRELDRKHPEKCRRPLALGNLQVTEAYFISLLLGIIALALAPLLSLTFFGVLVAYVLLNLVYSLKLKQVVILDIMCIAFGFVLRILAGTALAEIIPSDWLIVCTMTVSLFLGFSKRRNELALKVYDAEDYRKVLTDYSIPFLDQMIAMVTACTVMSYILYTVSSETVARFGTRNLVFTIPFVLFGIFRYLYLIYHKRRIEEPTDLILRDISSLVNILLWLGTVIFLIY
ncbi:MAG: decaprenyl-phosphate phosphoribosyltransferase [Thermodesulfobacteriota bacterium]